MKALVKFALGRGGMELRQIEKPMPKQDELLVRVLAAGISPVDLCIARDEYRCNMPVIMGLEYTGIIEALGQEVQGFKKGQQVVSMPILPRDGAYQHNYKEGIQIPTQGTMAEYICIPANRAFVLPVHEKDMDMMVIANPLACVIHAVIEKSSIRMGDIVLISGTNFMAQLTVLLAKMQGATVILYGTEANQSQVKLGLELGADFVCNDSQKLSSVITSCTSKGVDCVYECTGNEECLNYGIQYLKNRGTLLQMSSINQMATIDMENMSRKELCLSSVNTSTYTSWDILMKLVSQGKFDSCKRLIRMRIPLTEWETAFDLALENPEYKILLLPEALPY